MENTPLFFVFFLSGVAGLLFETLWFRLAGLSLGSTVWTSSIVLAAFMCGLGLGNAIAAWRGGALRRPLRAYAFLELLVGAFGLAAVILLPRSAEPLRPVFEALAEAPLALGATRLAVAFTLMLVPATAMGLTLPLLVKTQQRSDENFGRVLGRLYGWNTIGGVVGALAGELVLIPVLGILGAGVAAASLNAGAGVLALLLSRRPDPGAPRSGEALASETTLPFPAQRLGPTRLLLAAGLAGGLLLALEVVWFRFLQLFVQGTALAFAAMLATILFGVGLGGLLAGQIAWRSGGAWLVTITCWAGIVTSYLYATFDPAVAGRYNFLNDVPATLWLSFRLIFPTAVASGLLFTILGRDLRNCCPDPARATGLLTLANTIGATAGAVIGGFVLLPSLGMERSLFVLAGGYGVVGLLCWRRLPSRRVVYVSVCSVILFAAQLGLFPFGLLRNHFLGITLRHFECSGASEVIVREGVNETLMLLRFDWGGRLFAHRLVTNGFSMSGSYSSSRRYMKLFAYLPFALKTGIKRALLISYGVGNTAAALVDQPGLRTVDVVDISPEILGLADTIFEPRTNPLRDPRVGVHIEDGRFFLQTTAKKYDLITGEPPPPKVAGVANLYTREFFRLVFDRLNDGGIVSYWLPVHQLTLGDTRGVLRAFCDVFPTCSLWNGAGDDWIMLGVRGPWPRAEQSGFDALWSNARIATRLVDIGVERPELLGALFIADAPRLKEWIGAAAALEDNYPGGLAFAGPSPQDLALQRALADTRAARRNFEDSLFVRTVWPEALRARTGAYFAAQQALNDMAAAGHDYDPLPDLRHILTTTDLRVVPLLLAGSEMRYDEIAREGLAAGDSGAGLSYQLALSALAERDYERAARLFASARGAPTRMQAGTYEAFALLCGGRPIEARVAADSLSAAEREASPPGSIAWLASETARASPARPARGALTTAAGAGPRSGPASSLSESPARGSSDRRPIRPPSSPPP